MREIKFRAWDKQDKAMREVKSIIKFDGAGHYYLKSPESFYGLSFGVNNTRAILMQYTGLTDKNGKEIYEGDLLSSSDWNCNCEVIWEDGGFTLKEGDTSYNLRENLTDCDGNYLNDVEVIGNIYENKELLK